VEKARLTIEKFAADEQMVYEFSHLAKRAKAILILPQELRGAFIFGAGGGGGVLLVRDDRTGEWSDPAFYSTTFGSFGLQVGVDAAEQILFVMKTKGMESFYRSSFKLGVDASGTVGPVGIGTKGATTLNLSVDMVAFSRTKGAFIGTSLEGEFIKPSTKSNEAYYGKGTRPVDILVSRSVRKREAGALVEAVAKMTK
jgi:lipid-binding SYLF domain-containing protein